MKKIVIISICLISCAINAQSQICIVNQPGNQVLCSGKSTDSVNFSGGTAGTLYHWTNDNPGIGLPTSGTGNILPFVTINNTGIPQTANISVTASGRTKSNAYITNYSAHDVTIINTVTNTVIADVTVGGNPYGIAITSDGSKVYVANISDHTLSVINTANNAVSTIAIPFYSGPMSVALTPDDKKAYIACYAMNYVLVLNTINNTVLKTIPVGNSPFGVVISPDGKRAYVTNNNATGSVSIINTNADTLIATVSVGGSPHGLAVTPDNKKVYITNHLTYNPSFPGNTVSVLNTSSNNIIATIPAGIGPIAVAISPDGSKAYVGNNFSNDISIINTVADTIISTISGNALDPSGISITPDGKELYLENNGYNTVSVINTETYTITKTIPVGIGLGNGPITPGNFISTIPCTSPTKTFTITVNPTKSTACQSSNSADSLYVKLLPNIISGNTILRVKANNSTKINWQIFDAIGRKMMEFSQSVNPGQNDYSLHLGFLADAAYFLRGITTENKIFTLKFLRLQ